MASFKNREIFLASLDNKNVHMEAQKKIPKNHPFILASSKTEDGSRTVIGKKTAGPAYQVKPQKKGTSTIKAQKGILGKIADLAAKKASRKKLSKKKAA